MQIELATKPALQDERPGPHSPEELQRAFSRPHHLLQLVLVQRDRLHGSIARANDLWWLVGSLTLGTMLYALPFGAVIGPSRFWSIAVLLLGSIAICIPSLHVVGAFIGSRLELAQTLALSLVIASVASLFTFGFFPIIWFLGATMKSDSLITPGGMAVFLLCVSQFAGVVQFLRSQHAVSLLREFKASFKVLLFGWLFLHSFITFRLASALELL
jgi:hypothetical protein